jgi:hypothetical protein
VRKASVVEEHTVARIRHNNDIFRDANERIRAAASAYDHQMEQIPYLCECPVESCVEVIRLTQAEYEAVRADPNHYVTAVGHEAAEAPVGHVVARNDGYVVVEKP